MLEGTHPQKLVAGTSCRELSFCVQIFKNMYMYVHAEYMYIVEAQKWFIVIIC